jgi:hypothetical protein
MRAANELVFQTWFFVFFFFIHSSISLSPTDIFFTAKRLKLTA